MYRGERKTSIDNFALKIHYEYQKQLAETYKEEIERYEEELKAYEEALAKGGEVPEKPSKPLDPVFITAEPTVEAILKTLELGRPSLGLFSDEGGMMFGGFSFQKEHIQKAITLLSKLWDGKSIDRVRAGQKYFQLDNPRVSINLLLQPIIAEKILKDPLLQGQGFLARALIVYPEVHHWYPALQGD